ncbi:hypothetical protein R4B61_02775 [Fructilactobacillus vespulae]|uniref:hypothetical protein n=1 Tax=Fructilactobacillus vespulae TaxID=1249630 RepID=UPI0039B49DEF
MIKKRNLLFSIIGLCLFLTACGTSTNNSNKSTTKTTVHNTKKQENTASQTKKQNNNDSQKNNNQAATKQNSKGMNLDEIKNGNFAGIAGNWQELGSMSPKFNDGNKIKPGGDNQLTISNGDLKSNDITLTKDSLTTSDKSNPVVFNSSGNYLVAALQDETAPINWSVSFYPKNTTAKFSSDGQLNSNDLIAIWTSNNNYTEVFTNNN